MTRYKSLSSLRVEWSGRLREAVERMLDAGREEEVRDRAFAFLTDEDDRLDYVRAGYSAGLIAATTWETCWAAKVGDCDRATVLVLADTEEEAVRKLEGAE